MDAIPAIVHNTIFELPGSWGWVLFSRVFIDVFWDRQTAKESSG
ncbi:hypothetical protein M7I_5869 [Glarea lozoyensis 74030]|uniref:Uncharacterized protein n=1 Tax=Glarea lozoyensis (strain ATCC 74030 / MF5533) TaxID=1104152 RepID=H0ET15_GLAL7|nr:hypothetical protein M7I_5869 [Glarea lozoyensis 74030]